MYYITNVCYFAEVYKKEFFTLDKARLKSLVLFYGIIRSKAFIEVILEIIFYYPKPKIMSSLTNVMQKNQMLHNTVNE